MNKFWLTTAIILTPTFAGAAERSETCRRGEEVRVISIVAPGQVGAACDVVYVRDAGNTVSVPYNANSDVNYCRAQAAEMAVKLTEEGFACSTALSDEVDDELAGGAAAVAPAAPSPAPEAVRASNEASAAPVAETIVYSEQKETIVTEDVSAEAPTEDPAAIGMPVNLTANASSSGYRAPRPARSVGAGRLSAPPPSLDGIVDASLSAEAAPAQAAAAPTATAPVTPSRTGEEIVRKTLAANVAAWNDGDLAAFLDGYHNSAETTLIRGEDVATGIAQIKRRVEGAVKELGAMGRLAYSDLIVTFASDTVATVAGRYAIDANGAREEGALNVVMRQVDGSWRIVQDSRTFAARPPTH